MNAAIWGIVLNTTLQAAVHLEQDYEVNLRFVKDHLWNSVEQLFNETGRLIREQTEITGVHKINFNELTWMSTSLLCSRAHQITNAKTYVFSINLFSLSLISQLIRLIELQSLRFKSASASDNRLGAAHSPRTAKSVFCSR